MGEVYVTVEEKKWIWYAQMLLQAAMRIKDQVREKRHVRAKFLEYITRADHFMEKLEKRKKPLNLEYYYDLGMHYMVAYEYKHAENVFRRGLRLAEKSKDGPRIDAFKTNINLFRRRIKETKRDIQFRARMKGRPIGHKVRF